MKHGQQPRRGAVATLMKTLAIALAVVLVSGASVAAWVVYDLASNVSSNAVDIAPPDDPATPLPAVPNIDAFEGGFNMLVVGADNDENQDKNAYGKRDITLNDVNMLLHVSEDHTSAVVVSFPRDLVIAQPKCVDPETEKTERAVSAQPLNAAYERGGLSCVVATVSELTGLNIEYAALMSFDAVVQMTNAVGGVPVCLTERVRDRYSGLDLPAGTTTISGATALAFLRTRHGVGDGSDLSRIASQQQYISSLIRTIKSNDTLTDITKLYGLAQVAAKHVKLSTSLTNVTRMVAMARTLQTIDLDKLALVQYPVGTDPDNSNKVIPNKALAKQLTDAIAADRSFAPDSTVDRNGVEADPNAPVEPPVADAPAPEPPVTEPSAPGASATPAPTPTSNVIEGLAGQTALEQTCSVANR
ncbi:LytR family transcriptional regulator [Mycetocola zhadangensis]|uniref:LytR family transcriptional regulator n=2 Tax=Mycetocola zhadangensis TaxID=1164595 RepID=A0A3L7ISU8_9MICO|nr:LytR family transcriptional regulator [Mycetocola zhadangensis]